MQSSGVIYQYNSHRQPKRGRAIVVNRTRWGRRIALSLIALSLGGIAGPMVPAMRLEAHHAYHQIQGTVNRKQETEKPLPKSVPVVFNPLKTEDGASIEPASKDFGLVVPKVGINTAVIPAVNPADPGQYLEALKKGVAHASTSYFPDEDGTVYLFSHSTNYDWFVSDLNAVFYLLKNLTEGDLVVILYKGNQYTYRLREKRVVSPKETSYLIPQKGTKTLILQTCWPPGSTAQRLLLFADFVEESSQSI